MLIDTLLEKTIIQSKLDLTYFDLNDYSVEGVEIGSKKILHFERYLFEESVR